MRVAVISCAAYRDCWGPWLTLFRKFWPDCPYPLWLVTDEGEDSNYDHVFAIAGSGPESWCTRLVLFAAESSEPILFFLEDFFLSSPVNTRLVEYGKSLLKKQRAGCVRLYPCPGADMDFGDEYFGYVPYGAAYRISTMPAIWNPEYLRDIASQCTSPWSFEMEGTRFSNRHPASVLAFKRDVQPWPLEFICSGIIRSKWTSGALSLFKEHGIEVESARAVLSTACK